MRTFAKSPWTVLGVLISSIGSIISNSIIAYFIYISFTAEPVVGWWDIVAKCCICDMAVCFFPLPGGTGATELSFNALLGSLFTEGTLFWGILIWRILTYYLYIFQGIIILFSDMLHRKKQGLKPINYSDISGDNDDNNDNSTDEIIEELESDDNSKNEDKKSDE